MSIINLLLDILVLYILNIVGKKMMVTNSKLESKKKHVIHITLREIHVSTLQLIAFLLSPLDCIFTRWFKKIME